MVCPVSSDIQWITLRSNAHILMIIQKTSRIFFLDRNVIVNWVENYREKKRRTMRCLIYANIFLINLLGLWCETRYSNSVRIAYCVLQYNFFILFMAQPAIYLVILLNIINVLTSGSRVFFSHYMRSPTKTVGRNCLNSSDQLLNIDNSKAEIEVKVSQEKQNLNKRCCENCRTIRSM